MSNKAPQGHPSVRKEDFKSKTQTDEQRQSARNKKPFFSNYDYTDQEPDETSPGGGLYHGPMNKFKSVKEFIDKKRSKKKDKKAEIYSRLVKFTKFILENK